MTIIGNFRAIKDVKSRMAEAKKQLIAVGVPVSEATTAVAIAARESSALFSVQRENTLPYDHECFPDRALVGVEFVWGQNRTSGTTVMMLPSRIANDPDANALLTGRGWAVSDPKGGSYTYSDGSPLLTGPSYLRPTGGMEIAGDASHAYLFEWILINRKANMMGTVSFGPTMKNTINTGEAVRAGIGWGRGCGFPDTFDDIWKDYLANSWERMAEILNYMRVSCTKSNNPADHPNDDTANMAWLARHQTGGKPDSAFVKAYYTSYFKPNLMLALTL
jgi:hypothetical protein